jgi:hypothetical protein
VLVKLHRLDPNDPDFRDIIHRWALGENLHGPGGRRSVFAIIFDKWETTKRFPPDILAGRNSSCTLLRYGGGESLARMCTMWQRLNGRNEK